MTKKKSSFFSKSTISYIEATIYIIAIIVAIFVCSSGPIYIKMLPILFILGFVGRIIFDRPVITTVFGIITSLCIVNITCKADISDNAFISLCNGLNIALGELFGEYFIKSKKIFKKKKKLKSKGVLFTYCVTVIIFVASIGIHLYTSGDYISYSRAKNSLYQYLSETYKEDSFKIVNVKYTFYKTKSYTFEMRSSSKKVNTKFIVLRDNNYSVYDEYKFKVQSQNNTKINEEFDDYISSIETKLDFKIGYLNSGDVKLIISKSVENVNDNEVKDFALETNNFILNLKNFSGYTKIKNIELSLVDMSNNKNSLVSDFSKKDINDSTNSYEYILNSLDFEYIN